MPRLRIRTLLIAVVVAAAEFRLIRSIPIVGLLLLGPLVGSPLVGLLSRRRAAVILGGVAGGACEVALAAYLIENDPDLGRLGIRVGWGFYAGWLVVAGLAGLLVGLALARLCDPRPSREALIAGEAAVPLDA